VPNDENGIVSNRKFIQLTPALTGFKGPTIFIVIANIENKKNFKGLRNGFRYRQISVTGGSVIARFNCISKNKERRSSSSVQRESHRQGTS